MIPDTTPEEIEFVKRNRDPFRAHLDQGVEVENNQNRTVGIYRGMTVSGDIVLQPFLNSRFSKDRKRINRWETERPAFLGGREANVYPQPVEGMIALDDKNRLQEPEYSI